MGLLDDDFVQRYQSTALLDQEVPNHTLDHRDHFDLREHWDVVRTIRHRHHESFTRLPTKCLGLLQPDMGRLVDVDWFVRFVLHLVLAVLPTDASHQHGGNQIDLGEAVPHVPLGQALRFLI